jgi:glutaredoxin-like protein
MALISKKDAELLTKEFASQMDRPVKLIMFTQETECMYCTETRQIAEEVAALSDKVTAQVLDLVADKATAENYAIDKIPAIAVVRVEEGGERDYGIRFFGIPSGYEFTTLIETIWDVSKGATSLKPKTRQALAKVAKPVHIQVFITPT